MFVRFDVTETHHFSRKPLGVLHAIRYLRDDGFLTRAELILSNKIFAWMFSHLDAPSEEIIIKYPDAISWFRSTAILHISKTELLVSIAESHGLIVNRRQRTRLSRIVYQDSHQVLARSRIV